MLAIFVTDAAYHAERAEGLRRAYEASVPGAVAQVRRWLPEHGDRALPAEAARLVHARQHGATDWPSFLAALDALAAGRTTEPFLEAFEAMRAQAWGRLHEILERHPQLARARGTNGNTLLNLGVSLAGASCAPLPGETAEILDRLLGTGDVNQANDRGWAPLHQAAYANTVPLVEALLAAGADPRLEAYGEGGTPLAVALFWGHREAADALAARGVCPPNLRVAAGLGNLERVRACFAPDGALAEEGASGRGFYRPHTGFPAWQPSGHRQEVLDEALVWAAKADRVEVLPELVARGANVNADPYRGTPLAWAAANGRLGAARWLLDHGAELDRAGTFGGPSHGEGVTALHLAAQADRPEMVQLLLDRGANPSLTDGLYAGTPRGWAEHEGATRVLTLLRDA